MSDSRLIDKGDFMVGRQAAYVGVLRLGQGYHCIAFGW